mmetsp:Transcript_13733/g.31085  ORF Transcript_13733/g.31085 Transcript_13733/m.31085 type:complete len:216 (-) Transcript_13733:12-659(-)
MISSRWPRPTGTRLSTALRPDSMGSWTDCRAMIPGALTSIRWRTTSSPSAPLPSIGSPRPSTTRPSRPAPTGMSIMAPVRLTVSPSLMARSLPKTTTPTLSFSRLRAMPRRPLSNSTISPACTWFKPWTRAIPSPIASTLPTCSSSTLPNSPAILVSMIDESSDALGCPFFAATDGVARNWRTPATAATLDAPEGTVRRSARLTAERDILRLRSR